MEYNTEKAQEIAAKFNVSPITLNVWKNRGNIPDKYNTDAGPARTAETKSELDEHKRLLVILANEKLNRRNLCETSEVSYAKVVDAIRGKSKLKTEESLRIKKVINRLRIDAKKVVESLADKPRFSDSEKLLIDNLLKNELIIIAPMIGFKRTEHKTGEQVTTVYKRFDARLNKKAAIFEEWEVRYIIDRISIFLLETAL